MRLMGLDIGGTKCAVISGLSGDDGQFTITGKEVYATTDYPEPRQMILALQQGMERLAEKQGITAGEINSIGISCGGPLDSRRGIVLSPPNLPGWDDIRIVEMFSKKYGIPTFLQNDANACALAEWLMGAGRGTKNMVFLTFGTGMGAGLILDGRLYTGTNDLGGEVGHIRLSPDGPVGFGKAGSFEGFCSGGGIARLAASMVRSKLENDEKVGFCSSTGEIDEIDTRKIALAAAEGDELAREIIHISARYLGQGLAILIDILNPECIVIGSVYARNEHLFRPVAEKIIALEAIPSAARVCRIVPAALGDSVGDYAALCVAYYGKIDSGKYMLPVNHK